MGTSASPSITSMPSTAIGTQALLMQIYFGVYILLTVRKHNQQKSTRASRVPLSAQGMWLEMALEVVERMSAHSSVSLSCFCEQA